MSLSKEKKIQMFTLMLTIREFEDNIEKLFFKGEVPGFLHSYMGEEAVAVGVCSALNKDDYIISTHRGHGHIIAKGGQVKKMMAEIFAKSTGYCKGKGGSMHIVDVSLGILGANGIVGAGLAIAPGAALSAQMRKTDQVTVCFFGDGASNRGTFHEALNLSSIWNLPVIFICENNQYGMGTPFKRHMKIDKISVRAKSYDIPGLTVDGCNVYAVYDATQEALSRARNDEGPTLIECQTYRWKGHFIGDNATHYREQEEVDHWKTKCPIMTMEKSLLSEGILNESEIKKIKADVEAKISEAIEFSRSSPDPDPQEVFKDVYSNDCEECVK